LLDCWSAGAVLHSTLLFTLVITLNVSINSNDSQLFVLLV
jgi:hypothetical protein